jgi:hypothetical protein
MGSEFSNGMVAGSNLVGAVAAVTNGDRTPSELEQRRRDIVQSLTKDYRGFDDPEVPLELLRELALITSTLRRKHSGPPKAKKTSGAKPKVTLDDLMI